MIGSAEVCGQLQGTEGAFLPDAVPGMRCRFPPLPRGGIRYGVRMHGAKVALLTLVAVLLALVLLDQWRRPEQLGMLAKSFSDMAEANRAQTEELRKLRMALERGEGGAGSAASQPPVPVVASKPVPVAAPKPAIPNGEPALGVNFLLPLDRSYIDPAKMGGTFTSFSSSPKGLNPLIENEQVSNAANGLCNESLCTRDPRTPEKWSSELAESVIISDDYKTYTFSIRRGIRWQVPVQASKPDLAWLRKPVELTAEDFAFAVRLILDPKVDAAASRSYLEDLDRAEVPDPYTLRLVWKKKVYTSLAASLGLSPVPKHIYAANRDGSAIPADQINVIFNKHWFDEEQGICGVGAYQLVEFIPDKLMRFRRNPDYWTTPAQHNDGFLWNFEVKQDDAKLVAFKNGQVTTHGLQPLKYKSEVVDGKEPRFAKADPANPKAGRTGELGWELTKRFAFSYIGWNNRRPLFTDAKVRRAMSHAFPKERLIQDVFMGLGEPILSDVHPDNEAYNRTLQPYAFDLARAKALLAEAGWTDSDGDGLLNRTVEGKKLSFRFEVRYYANSPEWDNALSIYRDTLRQIGIELTPKPAEWKELLRVYEDRDFDAVVGTWGMSWDQDIYQLWHSSQIDIPNGSNLCAFANARVDALAIELRESFEPAVRKRILDEFQQIIHDEQPYTFFMSPKVVFAWQNRKPPGSTATGRYLEGVIKGLDTLHPLVVRSQLYWYLP